MRAFAQQQNAPQRSATSSLVRSNTPAYRRTIRIDSKLLADAERADSNKGKRDAAEELRQIIATVGKPGQPGEHVRCVVSVAMLNEGWDANNVTQILGIRAFGSQLLCEQVVGRGLRRMDYTPDPVTGLLTEEYVDVYAKAAKAAKDAGKALPDSAGHAPGAGRPRPPVPVRAAHLEEPPVSDVNA